ncbi:MAG: hypothetical protein AAGA54_35950 [Myxococcota bacterium]
MSAACRLVVASLLATGCGGQRFEPDPYDVDFDIPRSESFPQQLSAYGLFEEPMASLRPGERVVPYELSSELFTDYAEKQRLLRLPIDEVITIRDDGALEYPEGAVLVKTFFYPSDMRDPSASRRILETRLLVKNAGQWNAATYLWNEPQTDATLLLDGTSTAVSWLDESGKSRTTDYVVPHERECVTCHQSDGDAVFIGPTLRNLNRSVERDGSELNQLDHLQAQGILADVEAASAPSVPNDKDASLSLTDRARAYLDINCAHCHSPGRWDEAARRDLDFRYATPLGQTGLTDKPDRVVRQLRDGSMPYLGTTLRHDEGVALVLEYLESL